MEKNNNTGKNYVEIIAQYFNKYSLKTFVIENGTYGYVSTFFCQMPENKNFYVGSIVNNTGSIKSTNINWDVLIKTELLDNNCHIEITIIEKNYIFNFDLKDSKYKETQAAVKTMVCLYDLLSKIKE